MLECSGIGVCAFKASEVLLKFVGELTFPLQQNALLILQDGSNHDVCCSLPCGYLLEIDYRIIVIYYKLYTCGSKELLQVAMLGDWATNEMIGIGAASECQTKGAVHISIE